MPSAGRLAGSIGPTVMVAACGSHGEVAGDARGVAVGTDERHDHVVEALGAGDRVDRASSVVIARSSSSKTCGGADVSPPGQYSTRVGRISMIDRSKNSGMPKRFFTKLSMTGSLARHSGSSSSQPACRSSSTTRASPWIVARANGSAGHADRVGERDAHAAGSP